MKIDEHVTKPGIYINNARTAVVLQFETMDMKTMRGTGRVFQISMPTMDAMKVLGLLQAFQQRFDLPKIDGQPVHVEVPPKTELN